MTTEIDTRLALLDSLQTCPHRDLAKVQEVHQTIAAADPIFYAHLAAWYQSKGDVRDHKEAFVSHLLTSSTETHRQEGYMLLQDLPPYQVSRIIKFLKETIKKVPRSTRTAVAHYLAGLEQNQRRFDGAVTRSRKSLKHLYATLRIKPGDRAQAILFEGTPPDGSVSAAVKLLAQAKDSAQQAQIILDKKIPYPIAIGAIDHMTPAIALALLANMTPAEVVNNLGSLQRFGMFDHPEVKAIIEEKLKQARSKKGVSALKAITARSATQLDESTQQLLGEITDAQLKSKGRIQVPTALLVDKSSSMGHAIEAGKRLASAISAIVDTDFFVYAFDSVGYQLQARGTSYDSWEQAFQGIYPSGMTSIGVSLEMMRRQKQRVEQVILITDGGDNSHPLFANAKAQYEHDFNLKLRVVVIQTGNWSPEFSRMNSEAEYIQWDGDYYSLPNLIPQLAQASKLDLLIEIMSMPVPCRT